MKFFEKLKNKEWNYLLDHPRLKITLQYSYALLGTIVAAFCIAYTFRAFVRPYANINGNSYNLVAGGVSGFGQVILLSLEKMGLKITPEEENIAQSIIIIAVNIPLFLLSFFAIGKRFAILSAINVALCSVFISIIPDSWTTVFSIENDLLARAIFAGVLNGLGISIAVQLNHSTGGTDVVSTYFALKKGIAIGKYVLLINGSIVLAYTIISSVNGATPATEGSATMALYTLIFFFTSSVVINQLSTRNKKFQLQIVTSEPRLAKVLIQNFPHGCTILDGKGAFFDSDKKVILTVISSFELKRATHIIYKIDPNAFITVNNAYKVYGKFYIKPMK